MDYPKFIVSNQKEESIKLVYKGLMNLKKSIWGDMLLPCPLVTLRPKTKKVCLALPTDPVLKLPTLPFFSLKIKIRDRCPVLLECSRILVLVLNFLPILFYSVCSQSLYGYLRILSIQDGDVLVAFRFKKCDHKDQKSLFEATSHHQMNRDI